MKQAFYIKRFLINCAAFVEASIN